MFDFNHEYLKKSQKVKRLSRESVDGQTDRRTDTTKCIISPAPRSINIVITIAVNDDNSGWPLTKYLL